MRFSEMINTRGLSARQVQSDYADAVTESLNDHGRIALLQADTGVGKSLGYCVPAAMKLAEKPGARVIICSNTIALLRQLDQKDLPLAIDIVGRHTGSYSSHALLLGRQNYLSPARLEFALSELSEKQLTEHADRIEALRAWDDAIDLFVHEYGDLPPGLTADRICQTSYARDESYDISKREALEADILVCSHAMLVNDLLLGGGMLFNGALAAKETYLIVDEADLLHSMLIERQQTRINLLELRHDLRSFAKPPLIAKMDAIIEAIRPMAQGRTFITSEAIQTSVRDHLRGLINALRGYVEDEAQHLKASIEQMLGMTLNRMGVGVSPIRHEPAVVFINPFLPRVFERYVTDHYAACVLTSGTLSTFDDIDKGTQWIRRDLGISQAHTGILAQFSPTHFGKMSITLAGPDYPAPFLYGDEIDINPRWISAASEHISRLKGPVLVLTGSHQESRMLHAALGQGTLHQFGERLTSVVKRHHASDEQVLITAAGKVGLDMRGSDGEQYLQHVVLTRIPFQPRDEQYERELASYIRATHPSISNPESFVKTTRYMLNLNAAIRITKQSLGRGIRHPDDAVTFHLLDRRFPLYDQVGVSHNALRAAIPKRFIADYKNATVLQGAAALEEITLW
jgi:ATP-dependent DNA helicase DinG